MTRHSTAENVFVRYLHVRQLVQVPVEFWYQSRQAQRTMGDQGKDTTHSSERPSRLPLPHSSPTDSLAPSLYLSCQCYLGRKGMRAASVLGRRLLLMVGGMSPFTPEVCIGSKAVATVVST
jgi:hypothetical protein